MSAKEVILKWTTLNEENNSGFAVERQSEEGRWVQIGWVKGYGTANETHTYSFTDVNAEPGKYNYRLKQIDENGNYEYFDLGTKVVISQTDRLGILRNYQNKVDHATKVVFSLPVKATVVLNIYEGMKNNSAIYKNTGNYVSMLA